MKFVIALFAFVLASASFAQDYKCGETDQASGVAPRTLVLKSLSTREVREGDKVPYRLELFQGKKKVLSEKVIVEMEDVMFGFENKAKKIVGMIYLDELDQTYLYVGKDKAYFDCN
jgi:hypothetical protein